MLDRLTAAVVEVEEGDELDLDPKVLRSLIDRLEGKFSLVVRRVTGAAST